MTQLQDTIIGLTMGNPGALRVLCDIANLFPDEFKEIASTLQEFHIFGSLIWVGYKDHCKEDYTDFVDCILQRDEAMLRTIDIERNYL